MFILESHATRKTQPQKVKGKSLEAGASSLRPLPHLCPKGAATWVYFSLHVQEAAAGDPRA